MIFAESDGSPLERLPPFRNIDLIKTSVASQENFWKNVSKEYHPKECWLWLGSKNDEGYGNFRIGGKNERTHRVSYRLNNGYIPEGMCVCHSCDNPPCVNPGHLWLGTDQDNTDDKLRKGRGNHAKGDENGSRTHPERLKRGDENSSRKNPELLPHGADHWTAQRPEDVVKGEDVHTAQVTEEIVIEMRRLCREENKTCGEVAAIFSVRRALAYDALTGNSWAHLSGVLDELPKDEKNRNRGEKVNTAKLTPEIVRQIRSEYVNDPLILAGKRSRVSYALAEKYGVSRSSIPGIVSRKTWAHVQ